MQNKYVLPILEEFKISIKKSMHAKKFCLFIFHAIILNTHFAQVLLASFTYSTGCIEGIVSSIGCFNCKKWVDSLATYAIIHDNFLSSLVSRGYIKAMGKLNITLHNSSTQICASIYIRLSTVQLKAYSHACR